MNEAIPESIVNYYKLCSVGQFPRRHFLSDMRKYLSDREASAMLTRSEGNLVSSEKIIGGEANQSSEGVTQGNEASLNINAAKIRFNPGGDLSRVIIVI